MFFGKVWRQGTEKRKREMEGGKIEKENETWKRDQERKKTERESTKEKIKNPIKLNKKHLRGAKIQRVTKQTLVFP